jgi:lysophospholipase L1-like esterase
VTVPSSRFRLAWILAAAASSIYVAFMVSYYYRQQHLFDPFVGVPPPLITTSDANASLRVLALGGSTTECGDLPLADRYPTVLQARLREHVSDAVVFNAGRDWYTTRHSLINFAAQYQDWHPHLVVVLDAINDVYQSFSPAFYAASPYRADYSHFFGAAANGALPPTFEQYLYSQRHGPVTTHFWYEAPFVTERAVDYPVDRYWSLRAFRANLARLVRTVRAAGSQVVLVTQPSLYHREMTAAEAKTLWFGPVFCATRLGFARYEYASPQSLERAMQAFNGAIREIAASEGAALADADAHVPKTLDNFADDVHYTPAGAALVAQTVAQAIQLHADGVRTSH